MGPNLRHARAFYMHATRARLPFMDAWPLVLLWNLVVAGSLAMAEESDR